MSKRGRFEDTDPIEEPPTTSTKVEVPDGKDVPEIEFEDDYNDDTQENPTNDPRFIGASNDEMQLDRNLSIREMIQNRKRTRQTIASGFIDYTQTRYYDRYKQQEYTRRNDYMKYCHVCRKKTVGKLRVLPGDLRMRKVWILRSNLDEERSAELWLRELACEGSHGGEYCEIHFPPGSNHLKGSQLFPLDVRPQEGRHSVIEDIMFEFDSIVLQCVFCGREGHLSAMLPFIRNRSKRSRWIETLSNGDVEFKRRLQQSLRGGVTQFLCDWHISDSSFEINGFGEWRLLRNALPDPHLTAEDKRGQRVYLVDKCRDPLFWDRHMWRDVDVGEPEEEEDDDDTAIADAIITLEEDNQDIESFMRNNDIQQEEQERNNIQMIPKHLILKKSSSPMLTSRIEDLKVMKQEHDVVVEKEVVIGKCVHGASTSIDNVESLEYEYSDDSDEENEMLEKNDEIPYSERLCQVCSRIESVPTEFPFKSDLRTWPFDEYRHKKWLEIMDWPQVFEESMKTLWQKRKTEGTITNSYHFCPINVCQSHLDFRKLPEKMDQWLKTFCVVCDSCLSSEHLVVPFPVDFESRLKWVNSLFPLEKSKFQIKKFVWLRQRLLRPKATRYRICVYHFGRDSFFIKETGEKVFDPNSIPLSMEGDDFDVTPRGPTSVCKCNLCDDWKKRGEMALLRYPVMESEKVFLADNLLHAEKNTIKKMVTSLNRAEKSALVCLNHFPEEQDPFTIIGERRLMYGLVAECVLCSHSDDCTAMLPFPSENEHKMRTKWINSMCREPWVYRYLTKRLGTFGRHYLCSAHFNRNALKYQPGLGVWRKAGSTPLLACTNEEERQSVWNLSKSDHEYHPLLVEQLDTATVLGVTSYEHAVELVGMEKMGRIENELHKFGQTDLRSQMMGRSFDEIELSTIPLRELKSAGEEHDNIEYDEEEEEIEEIEHHDINDMVEHEEIVQEECVVYNDEHHLEHEEE